MIENLCTGCVEVANPEIKTTENCNRCNETERKEDIGCMECRGSKNCSGCTYRT